MTWDHEGRIGASCHAGSQRARHRDRITSHEVGAPDRPGEQQVTGQQDWTGRLELTLVEA
jgi:hypothetical protein